MGSLSLLQGFFPTQVSNQHLLHCRWILYHLSHQESPRILEWVTYPFASRSSEPRNRTGVSCITGEFFTNWVIREAQARLEGLHNILNRRLPKSSRWFERMISAPGYPGMFAVPGLVNERAFLEGIFQVLEWTSPKNTSSLICLVKEIPLYVSWRKKKVYTFSVLEFISFKIISLAVCKLFSDSIASLVLCSGDCYNR